MDANSLKCGAAVNATKSDLNVAKMPPKSSTTQEVVAKKTAPTAKDMIPTGVIDDIKNVNPTQQKKANRTKKGVPSRARNPPAIVHNRKNYPYGAAVSINGKHFDKKKWPHKREAPTLLGINQNPYHYDGKEAEEIDETSEAFVTFVVSGHYQWKETDMLNTVSGKYKKNLLNIISFPPRDTKPIKYRGKTDPLRHFVKGHGKWDLRNHKNPCIDCGSPWCEFKKHKKMWKKL